MPAKIKNQSSLVNRLIAVSIGLFGVALTVIGFWIYMSRSQTSIELMREKAMRYAQIGAEKIISSDIEQIYEENSKDSNSYIKVQSNLKNVKNLDNNIDDVYILTKTEKLNIWKFTATTMEKKDTNGDGTLQDSEVAPEIGEEFDVSPFPEIPRALAGPTADKMPGKDKWGVFLSGYAPIISSIGINDSIVGVDYSSRAIESQKQESEYLALALILLGAVIFLGTDLLTHHFYLAKDL